MKVYIYRFKNGQCCGSIRIGEQRYGIACVEEIWSGFWKWKKVKYRWQISHPDNGWNTIYTKTNDIQTVINIALDTIDNWIEYKGNLKFTLTIKDIK